jgi:hypothetical protein
MIYVIAGQHGRRKIVFTNTCGEMHIRWGRKRAATWHLCHR